MIKLLRIKNLERKGVMSLTDDIAGLKATVNSTIGEDNFKTLSDWI